MATLTIGDKPARAVRRDIEVFLEKEILDRINRFSVNIIRREAGQAADAQLAKTFQWIANQIVAGGNFKLAGFSDARGKPWKPYSPKYAQRKMKKVGHRRWFLYDAEDDDEMQSLAEWLRSVNPQQIITALGKSRIVVSSDQKTITVVMAPRVAITRYHFEEQLKGEGWFDDHTLAKLRNQKNAYRPVLGPSFIYVAQNLVPGAVRRRLRNLK
jgi:hypothetical protein